MIYFILASGFQYVCSEFLADNESRHCKALATVEASALSPEAERSVNISRAFQEHYVSPCLTLTNQIIKLIMCRNFDFVSYCCLVVYYI